MSTFINPNQVCVTYVVVWYDSFFNFYLVDI
jgi:hypothetical protein